MNELQSGANALSHLLEVRSSYRILAENEPSLSLRSICFRLVGRERDLLLLEHVHARVPLKKRLIAGATEATDGHGHFFFCLGVLVLTKRVNLAGSEVIDSVFQSIRKHILLIE